MAEDKLVKVLLHNRGEDVETPWAEDLGPTLDGGRKVRLDNVPFLHAKPTFGDVIVVREDPRYEGQLAWDRDAVTWDQIGSRLAEDGGRYAMIVDYDAADVDRFGDLGEWLAKSDIVPEGCFGPRDDKPGRLYLAVPKMHAVAEVMAMLGDNELGFRFEQIHPDPGGAAAKPRAKPVKKKAAAKPAAKAKAKPAVKTKAKAKPAAKAKKAQRPAAKTAVAKGKGKAKVKPKAKKPDGKAKKPAARRR
jgi:hypothetical protein